MLKKEMEYSIYLPEGYDSSDRKYPVLYLLHGINNPHSCWVQQGDLGRIADASIASGKAPEMIIVVPDAQNSFYVNAADGSYNFEDYFIREFVPYIDQHYRTRTSRKFRAISGLSMGGHGALLYALKFPELFSRCYAMSPGVFTNELAMKMTAYTVKSRGFDKTFGWDTIPGGQRLNAHYLANSPYNIVKNMPTNNLKKVQFYIDCGDDDYLLEGNLALLQIMRERKMNLEYRMRDGAHVWAYWRSALPMAMEFVGENFLSNGR